MIPPSQLDNASIQRRIRGVYAITRDEPDTGKLTYEVAEALNGGVRLLQYRNKLASTELAHEQANALRRLTYAAGATLIINDNVQLALAVGADGVHLGRDDMKSGGLLRPNLQAIRERSGKQGADPFVIGLSCYNQWALAVAAVEAGADYIAFGSFFSSPTKPNAVTADMTLIRDAKQMYSLPVVAIGGITAENAPQLLSAGADALASISAIFASGNIRERSRFLTSFFNDHV